MNVWKTEALAPRIEILSGTEYPIDGRVSVCVLLDQSLIETFCKDGQMVITQPFDNSLDIEHIEAFATGSDARLVSLQVIELNGSWK